MTYVDLMMTQIARARSHRLTSFARWLTVITLVLLISAVALNTLFFNGRVPYALGAGILLAGFIGAGLVTLTYVFALARLAMALRREPRFASAAGLPEQHARDALAHDHG
jgi:membrane protein YdbS with pleckstrin-like domain